MNTSAGYAKVVAVFIALIAIIFVLFFAALLAKALQAPRYVPPPKDLPVPGTRTESSITPVTPQPATYPNNFE